MPRQRAADGDPLAAGAGDSSGVDAGDGVGGLNRSGSSRKRVPVAESRITHNPAQCGGKPCIRGMRIRVSDVLDLYAAGLTADQILSELPDLRRKICRRP